jgi:putative ABC transport system ATP-binding protein
MPISEAPVISLRHVNYSYGAGSLRRQVLFDVTCDIWPGEIVIITGPSGSGKTTVLSLAGALRSMQQGSLKVLGEELQGARSSSLVRIRENIGFIFQLHNLLECLTARQNVEIALGVRPLPGAEARARSTTMLQAVGLGDRLDYPPSRLSGGQRQRVAVARARWCVNRRSFWPTNRPRRWTSNRAATWWNFCGNWRAVRGAPF